MITEHITGQTVEYQTGASAQAVVDGVVQSLGLPRRTENGEVVTYRLLSRGVELAPNAAVTGDVDLVSDLGRDVYARVDQTLDDVEAALGSDQPPVHLSTRIALARRTGALSHRVESLERAFQEKAFSKPVVASKAGSWKSRAVPAVGLLALVAFFGWLFWYTEPDAPDLVIAQENSGETTVLEGPAEVDGRIDQNREVDLYSFEAVEGDFVIVAMIAAGNLGFEGGFDAELSVDGPDGSQVAYNDDFNGLNSQVSFEVDESGEYIIRARTLGGCCVGDYVLIFELSR